MRIPNPIIELPRTYMNWKGISITETIRVLIADDHPVVREGLRGLIEIQTNLYQFHPMASYLGPFALSLLKGDGIYDSIGANWY